jgi:predicted ester cyclase
MAERENKALVRRLFDEIFNHGSDSVVDELVAENYVDHSPFKAPAPGAQGFKMRTQMLRSAFVQKVDFGPFLAEDDLVAFSWTFHGVHTGPLMGIAPTGIAGSMSGINVERLANGKIVEHWSQFDLVGLLRQLGQAGLPKPPGR